MKWSKNSQFLQEDPFDSHIDIVKKNKKRSTLIIRNVNKNDSGVYGCHATDPNSGQIISMYGKLGVTGKKDGWMDE